LLLLSLAPKRLNGSRRSRIGGFAVLRCGFLTIFSARLPPIWEDGYMDEHDLSLRSVTYGLFVELGRAPTASEVAGSVGLTEVEVVSGWQRLHEQHALVLDPATAEIRMANPFSAVPTAYRVKADGRWWYANCAWDAFGICAALHADGRIETSCPDCAEPVTVEVRDERPDDESLLFHCLVPAARWWGDIVFT
jgi:hypothetical protein